MNCQENGLNTTSEQCLMKDFCMLLLSMIFNIWLLKIRLLCSFPITQIYDYICFAFSSRAELSMQKVMKKESCCWSVTHSKQKLPPLLQASQDSLYLSQSPVYICSSNQDCEELGSLYLHRLVTTRILLLSDLH